MNENFPYSFIITPTIIEQYNVSKVKALSAEKVICLSLSS
jgi:hypothetical protein